MRYSLQQETGQLGGGGSTALFSMRRGGIDDDDGDGDGNGNGDGDDDDDDDDDDDIGPK